MIIIIIIIKIIIITMIIITISVVRSRVFSKLTSVGHHINKIKLICQSLTPIEYYCFHQAPHNKNGFRAIMFVHMSIQMSIHMSVHMSSHMPIHMSLRMSHACTHVYTHVSTHVTCLHTCLYTCLCLTRHTTKQRDRIGSRDVAWVLHVSCGLQHVRDGRNAVRHESCYCTIFVIVTCVLL